LTPRDRGYATNYLIDLDRAVIVEVEASSAVRQAEVTTAKTMIASSRFDHHPRASRRRHRYGSAEMLDWLVNEQGIEPHVPMFDKSQRTDGTFSRDGFTYDHERDVYVCFGRQAPNDQRHTGEQRRYTVPPSQQG
jgi:hypothetical protein